MRSASTFRSVAGVLATAVLLSISGCSSTDSETEDATATSYGSMGERLSDADFERWIELKGRLQKNFADVCGDTFCGSGYSNLTSVSLECSATKTGTVNSCTWVFGGSIEYVDGKTGSRNVDARSFVCPIAVHMKAGAFLDALLDEEDSIKVAMPSTDARVARRLASAIATLTGTSG